MTRQAVLAVVFLLAWGAQAQFDCFGVPAGSDTYDACGICGGNATSGTQDACGLCLGNTSCCTGIGLAVFNPSFPEFCCDCPPQTCGIACLGIVFLDLLTGDFVCHMQDGTDVEFILLPEFLNGTGAINVSCTVMGVDCQGNPGAHTLLYTDEICNGIDDNCDGFIDVNTTDTGGPQVCGHAGICQWGLVDCSSLGTLYCEPRIAQPALVTGECVNASTTGCHEFKNHTCDACGVDYDDFDVRMDYHVNIAMRHQRNFASVRIFPASTCSHVYFKVHLDGVFETNDATVADYMSGVFASDYLLADVEVGHNYTNTWTKTSTEATLTSTTQTALGKMRVQHVLHKEQKYYSVGLRNFSVPADYVKTTYSLINWTVVHASHYVLLRLRITHRASTVLSPAPKTDLSEIYFTDADIEATLFMQPDYEDAAGAAYAVLLRLEKTAPTITTLFVFMPVEGVAGVQSFVYDPHMVLRLVPADTPTATSAPAEEAAPGTLPLGVVLAIVFGSMACLCIVVLMLGAIKSVGGGPALAFRTSRTASGNGKYANVSDNEQEDDDEIPRIVTSTSIFTTRRKHAQEDQELHTIK